jgi:quinate/shikimate dehydrogenase
MVGEQEVRKMAEIPISGHTQLYCLIGDPVAHSISPAMHNEAFTRLGIDSRYVAFDVKPEDLEAAVEGMRKLGIRGWNITMPHKNRMKELCDRVSKASEICGACNTVKNEDGVLYGTTTDGAGWMESAKFAGHDPVGKNMVQLGAGGAGTSILVTAAIDGVKHIDLFNAKDKFWPRVEEMVEKINAETSCRVDLHDLADLERLRAAVREADILLNTTPVGMAKIPGCLIPDAGYFHDGLVVSDVIYEPRETELLRMARESGLSTFNGMYMLLYQGAESFKIWTGQEMPVDIVREKYFAG